MPMTGSIDRVEVITSVQRRRRWSAEEKARIVQETYAPGMSVSLVARQHGVAPNQVFKWRQLYAEGALSAVGAGEEVVAASEYRALQHQVRELKRDYARVAVRPEAASVLRQLDFWFEHYKNIHPHKALDDRSPREFRKQLMEKTAETAVGFGRKASPRKTARGCGILTTLKMFARSSVCRRS